MKKQQLLKTILTMGFTFASLFFLMSFTDGNYLQTSTTTSQNWTSWSKWYHSDCYTGISYRYRERETAISDKNQIQVEIKNGYNKGISIGHRITTNPNDEVMPRLDLAPQKIYTREEYVLKNKQMYVKLDKLRFEGDSYGDPYRGCDG
ncbi:MAG TPA: hypothetical protein VFD80_01965 [Flavobacteriaceae bacterium]|nr:hypothetical protein [Flavobacteriaceae bacterium]